MIIHDFLGQHTCDNEEELLRILSVRAKNKSNDFELCHEEQYPYLAILVNGDKACVHYFLNESDSGHYTYVEENGLSGEGFTTFHIGSEESETQIENRLVIPVEKAYIAAKVFFNERKMTTELLWYAL
jgi:hypothetical protein